MPGIRAARLEIAKDIGDLIRGGIVRNLRAWPLVRRREPSIPLLLPFSEIADSCLPSAFHETPCESNQRLNRNSFDDSTAQKRSSSASCHVVFVSPAASAMSALNFAISAAFGSRLRASK